MGDPNARHHAWDKATSARGRAIHRWARMWNLKVTSTRKPSYRAIGRVEKSYSDLMLGKEKVETTQPEGGSWVDSLDHTAILYKLKEVCAKRGILIISKTVLANRRNREEVAKAYGVLLGALSVEIRKAKHEEAQVSYEHLRKTVVAPWEHIMRRRPRTRTPHWNFNLDHRWKLMRKARVRANRSGLQTDWDIFETSRNHFVKENRNSCRRFRKRTDELLQKSGYCQMSEACRRDKRRREERRKGPTITIKKSNPRTLSPSWDSSTTITSLC